LRVGLTALVALPGLAGAQTPDTLRVVHLLQRATYGARPEDIALTSRIGLEAWLDRQLHPETIDDSALERRLRRFPTATMNPGELFSAYPPTQHAHRMTAGSAPLSPMELRQRGVLPPSEIAADMANVKLQRAVYSERQLLEVMTDFWFNHLNVDFGKGQAKWLVADYEARAIRPHVFGRFEDLLIASATHPAMLIYLDNRMNLARAGESGINENYSRELLELHTLGVDGGYGQQDVVEVARAFTGWTIVGLTDREALDESFRGVAFAFRAGLHDRAPKTILGQEFPGGGIEEGYAILSMLARHPSTARRVATKLVQAFASDDAPPELVDEIARVYLDTDGDLAAVTRALFTSPGFYEAPIVRAKVKSPFELVASALRLTQAEVGASGQLVETLHTLGHAPYMENAPTGYPETNGEWLNAGALVLRIEFALALANGEIRDVQLDPLALAGTRTPEDPAGALSRRLVPGSDTAPLEAAVRGELEGAASREKRARSALGLILGSLDFQRH
jgi:uncharacterized protein (DUF1800 family)